MVLLLWEIVGPVPHIGLIFLMNKLRTFGNLWWSPNFLNKQIQTIVTGLIWMNHLFLIYQAWLYHLMRFIILLKVKLYNTEIYIIYMEPYNTKLLTKVCWNGTKISIDLLYWRALTILDLKSMVLTGQVIIEIVIKNYNQQ